MTLSLYGSINLGFPMIPLSHQRIRVHGVASNNIVRLALYRCNPVDVCPTALYCTFICDVVVMNALADVYIRKQININCAIATSQTSSYVKSQHIELATSSRSLNSHNTVKYYGSCPV